MNGAAVNLMEKTFSDLKAKGETALIPFISVGDPDPETTVDIIVELERAGADVLELGVPYSDPLADGPVIQRASERALVRQITIESCIDTARKARERGVNMPFVLFTYYNPVLQTGLDRFFGLLQEAGISGLIIPDLPFEESEEVLRLADQANILLVPLVAPTSSSRISMILSRARGFVYCVSSLGVTGERSAFHQNVDEFIQSVRAQTKLPVAVGFGISNREQAERFAKICDGVVVGSAIVRKIEESLPLLENEATKEQGLLQIRDFVAQLKIKN
ncbi:tryptophan synthase subunit alpha [Paenibacillus sp. Marseille-P2973]|uniref:tryptophan synthase subunit alpha n=1 Tax=Paenibacillus sp. Marseille-P2973 TaxID=1871032 RepID=UPI001B371C55|nr:tryptophan synthase subunit alpha [Paenibacillus sp. Marseille-P2973]MBQ4898464.1 tryptophan synthase subunit alpha [Paenibacillus sp. Marseille-P2973]